MSDLDQIMRNIASAVPSGRENRQGMRVWRETLEAIRTALADALAANTTVGLNTGQIATNTADIATNTADIAAHVPLVAAPGVLGHIQSGAAPVALVTLAPLPAPPLYTPAHIQSIIDRQNDIIARLDSLIASLQGNGTIQ